MASIIRLRILAFGASLTEGFYSEGCSFHPYTLRLTQLLQTTNKNILVENAGVSGEAVLSDTMLPRLKKLLLLSKSKYDWVLILAGTNDTMRDQQKASRVFDGYKRLIDECHKHGARVLSMTLPETEYPKDSPFDKERQEFNRLIREELVAKTNDDINNIIVLDVDRFIPLHTLSNEEREEIWDDGVHLKPKGYDRLGQLIYETLKPHLL